MTDQFIRDYCLQLMGVTQWQLRKHSDKIYLLILDEPLIPPTNHLLAKMLQALNWPRDAAQVEQVTDLDRETFFSLFQNAPYQKALIFGERLVQNLSLAQNANPFPLKINPYPVQVAVLPNLATLLNDVAAKKQAWAIMKKL